MSFQLCSSISVSAEKEKKHKKKHSVSNGVQGTQPNLSGNVLQHLTTVAAPNTAPSTTASIPSTTTGPSASSQLSNGIPTTGSTNKQSVAVKSDLGSGPPSSSTSPEAINSNAVIQNGVPAEVSASDSSIVIVPKLPQSLPKEMEECIQKLKDAASAGGDEGKCKFFSSDVNHTLLE